MNPTETILALELENERLRKALSEIADVDISLRITGLYRAKEIAHKALLPNQQGEGK